MNKPLIIILVLVTFTSILLTEQINSVQGQSSLPIPKIVNSTTIQEIKAGNLTNIIKHPSVISVLTITPWPNVKPGQNFNISGELIDGITLKPLANATIEFKVVFKPLIGFSIQTLNIPSQHTDKIGSFSVKSASPNQGGIITVIALYKGDKQHYATISVPSLFSVLTF
ncbi:MAG TPA: hypothetical protein VN704_11735 [Verrucomicrobiae bacterium]|nr:hypothetical protein [Verrucomicrobiae bacterium]